MTEFWLGLADIIQGSFIILTTSENIPNIAFIVIGFVFFIYWMMQLSKFKKNDILE